MRFVCNETLFFANHNGSSAETGFINNFYIAFIRRFVYRINIGFSSYNITSIQTYFSNIFYEEGS